MKLVTVPACPINGQSGEPARTHVVDAFFGSPGEWSYFRDRQTGHLWLNPRPADSEIGGLYQQYYTHGVSVDAAPSTWKQAMTYILNRRLGYPPSHGAGLKTRLLSFVPTVGDAAEMEVLRIPASESGRLLDVGCGDGGFMARMAQFGWSVAGVEPDEKAVGVIRDRFGFDARSSLEDSSDWHGCFDVITMNHVIEHVPDPIAMLRQCLPLLKPTGRLIATTPNAASLGSRLFGRHWRGLEAPRHLNVFSAASLYEAAAAAGLRVNTLSFATRLARGIFFTSYWASKGRERIELETPSGRLPKVAGYGFQLAEAALATLRPDLAEEIVCVASPNLEA